MAFTLTAARKNAALDTLTTAAGATATVKIYSGSVPTNADAALGGATLLVSMPCSATVAPAASGGVWTANAVTQTNAAAAGTASFYRFIASDGTTVLAQGACGVSGSDMNMVTTTIALSQPVQVTSWTISV
jgi:hypothetical protein